MKIDEWILGFARCLRKGGMEVSLSEVEDALKAIELVGLSSFKTTLKAVFVKTTLDEPVFEKAFLHYFANIKDIMDEDNNQDQDMDKTSSESDIASASNLENGSGMKPGGGSCFYLSFKCYKKESKEHY